MTKIVRPADDQFDDIAFARHYAPTYLHHGFDDLDDPVRLAVIDEPAQGEERGAFLLLHGEPSWSALYERWIPALTDLGYRCVAPDLVGFGRSDKVAIDEWYSYERHVETVRSVIEQLELGDLHLVVQDWAGPIGLRQLVDMPERFARAFVFNTWLHHDGYEYTDGVHRWREMAIDPTRLGGDMPTGRIVVGTMRRPVADAAAMQRTFDAPFTTYESKAGARAFPTMLPFAEPERSGAAQQQRCWDSLTSAPPCPIHVVFGDADPVFTYERGVEMAAAIPGATIDPIPGAGHFVQADAPDDCIAAIRRHLDGA